MPISISIMIMITLVAENILWLAFRFERTILENALDLRNSWRDVGRSWLVGAVVIPRTADQKRVTRSQRHWPPRNRVW